MRKSRILHISCAAFLLAGCTVGPDFAPPDAPATHSYLPGGDAVMAASGQHVVPGEKIAANWWTLFQSPALDQTVRQAMAGSYTIAAARGRVEQAMQSVNAASGSLWPQLSLDAQAGRQKYGAALFGPAAVGSLDQPFTYYEVGPAVSYTLDLFGGTRRAIEQQQALAQYQGEQLNAAYLTLTGDVVDQALAIADARAKLAMLNDIIDEDKRNSDLIGKQFEAGGGTRVDVLSADSQLASDETLIAPVKQQLAVARDALAVLVGQAPADWSAPDFDLDQFTLPAQLPVTLPSELVHDRPDIRAAEANLHAASAAVGVATASQYPNITLSADTLQEALTPGNLFMGSSNAYAMAAGLTMPIFNGGTLEAQKRGAADAYESALATYRQTVVKSFGEVADDLQALDHDSESIAATQHALEVAQSSLKLARLSYQAGNSTTLQVLDAERLSIQAKIGYIDAESRRLHDTAHLFLALGGSQFNGSRMGQGGKD